MYSSLRTPIWGKNVKEWCEILYQERTCWVQWLWIPIPSNTMTTRDHGRCSWGSQEEEQQRLENAEDGCRALSENKIRFCNFLLPIPRPNRRIQQPKHSDIPIKKRLLSNQKVYIRNLQSQKRSCHGKSLALTAQCLSSFSVRTWAWQ